MVKRQKKEPERNRGAHSYKKNGKRKGSRQARAAKDTVFSGNQKLIECVRQIISETPEIRPEKVAPLQEAVAQGTYTIDVRKLANILITKMFQDL
jgi:flagellar biosynthesis anti-sigma factor FlgM